MVKRLDIPDFIRAKQYVVVAGAQKGDEGKGKVVLYVSQFFGVIARVGGGSGTGASAVHKGKKQGFHLIPTSVMLNARSCYK